MKTVAKLTAVSTVIVTSLLWAGAFAQSAPSTPALPPPGINDPGVHVVAAPNPAAAPAASASAVATPSPAPMTLPAMRSGDSTLGRGTAIPQVSVRQEGDNTVQEYRRNGRVYMLVVTPKHGLTQTYMVDPQGRVVDEHGQRRSMPTMYKVFEWGKSKPATADSSSAPSDNSDSQ